MPVLAAATEAAHIKSAVGGFVNLLVVDTPVGCFDANASRAAFNIDTNNAYELDNFVATADLWVHLVLHRTATTADQKVIWQAQDGVDGNLNGCFRVLQDTATTLKVQFYTAAAWTDVGTITGVTAGVLETYDFNMKINAGDIAYRAWRDSSSVLNTTSTTSTEFTNVDRVLLGDPNSAAANATGAQVTRVSQVIVADEATVGWVAATMYPTAAGTFSDWVGDFSNVDEFTYDPSVADSIQVTAINKKNTFTMSDINAAFASYSVVDVIAGAFVQNNATSVLTDMQFLLRTNATDFNSTNLGIVKDGNVKHKTFSWSTNPDTTAAWTIAELNSLEFGLESK